MFTREKGQHSTQLLETPLYKGKELGGVLATFAYLFQEIHFLIIQMHFLFFQTHFLFTQKPFLLYL